MKATVCNSALLIVFVVFFIYFFFIWFPEEQTCVSAWAP